MRDVIKSSLSTELSYLLCNFHFNVVISWGERGTRDGTSIGFLIWDGALIDLMEGNCDCEAHIVWRGTGA